MQRLNRKKKRFTLGTKHPITILADLYVQVKLLDSYKFGGGQFLWTARFSWI